MMSFSVSLALPKAMAIYSGHSAERVKKNSLSTSHHSSRLSVHMF